MEPFLYRRNRPGWDGNRFVTFYNYKQHCRWPRPVVTLRYMDAMHTVACGYDAVGFKLMYGQMFSFPEMVVKLVHDKYRIIHLVRRNYLDIYLSLASAVRRGQFHTEGPSPPVCRLHVDPDRLLRFVRRMEKKVLAARRMAALLPCPVKEVVYEELAANREGVTRSALEFIGVSATGVNPGGTYRKISRGSHRERIMNYDAVVDALRNTRYEWMLTDGPADGDRHGTFSSREAGQTQPLSGVTADVSKAEKRP